MPHTNPQDVISPRTKWRLLKVLYDGGEDGWAAAEGTWDGEPVVGIRYNGNPDKPLGHPISNSRPVWFILPEGIRELVRVVAVMMAEAQRKRR